MKVFNLTDVPTKVLTARHLVNQSIVVGKELVNPGGDADVEDTPHMRETIKDMVAAGALSIDKVPPPYALAKSKPGQTRNVQPPAVVREPPAPAPTPMPEPEPAPEKTKTEEAPEGPPAGSKKKKDK